MARAMDPERAAAREEWAAWRAEQIANPTPVDRVEAVQRADWKPWHAVWPESNVTLCGVNVLGMKRNIGHLWVGQWENERCKSCTRLLASYIDDGLFTKEN